MEKYQREYLARFYQTYYQKLYLHAFSILHGRELAEEAVQEAFETACKKPDDLMLSEKPLGWMKKAVEYAALHILREQRMAQSLTDSLEDLPPEREPAVPDDAGQELMDQCLEAVSREELELFRRIALDGYSFTEEATQRGISVSALYKRYERIRHKLRGIFGGDGKFL